MILELINHFRILKLTELVRQHQDFKDAVFHKPLRICLGILLRALTHPVRNWFRNSAIVPRTQACRPLQQFDMAPRFVAIRNDALDTHHLIFTAAPACCSRPATVPIVHLDSGHDRVIFVHAFYAPEAQILFDRLDEYPDYDLVLTTPVSAIRDAFLARFNQRRAVCVQVPNQGRDILPFLLSLNILDLQRYRYFIKIHTKRSSHRSDGVLWFRLNLEFLLGDRNISNAFFALIDADRPCLYGVESMPIQDHLENNRYWLKALLGCQAEQAHGQFIPGSMFMGTGVFLQKLAARQFELYPMEAEAGQLDGTLAHALERYIGYLATDQGGECLSIDAFLKKRGAA